MTAVGRRSDKRRDGARRAAVDLCDARYDGRVGRLLIASPIDITRHPSFTCAAWAGLECALKLRELGIPSLLDARLRVSRVEAGIARVSGLGAPATVNLAETQDFALAWAEEA